MSGDRHPLPSGAWVEFRDGSTLSERDRRPIRSKGAMLDDDLAQSEKLQLMSELNDLAAAAMISSASFVPEFGRPTVDDILNLQAADYDALTLLMTPRLPAFLDGVNFEPNPDPKALGGPASD